METKDTPNLVEADNGRLVQLPSVKREPKYSTDVHELFKYWNDLGVRPVHRAGTLTAKNCYTELHNKLHSGITVAQIKEVFDKYRKAYNHPRVRQRMNKGNPISLPNLLNNKKYGGIFDWWEFFFTKTISEIADHYIGGKREAVTFNQADYDDNPELTKKIAKIYCDKILGDPNAIDLSNLGKDERYEKFRECGKKAEQFWKRNKGHPLFKTLSSVLNLLVESLKAMHNNPNMPITAGYLSSDTTWNSVFPSYMKNQGIGGLKWRSNA